MENYITKMILENFIPAIFTTAVVFVLTSFAMYIHFSIRKSFYNKMIPLEVESVNKDKENINKLKKLLEDVLKKQFKNCANELVAELNTEIIRYELALWRKEMNISEWKDYSIYRYIIN